MTSSPSQTSSAPDWQPSACILCECNCGIEVQLGGEDGRQFERIRGDKQNPPPRGTSARKPAVSTTTRTAETACCHPCAGRPMETYEEIGWDTAIREVAERFTAVRDQHGGESIFYYGGGGQGNHLPGAYARSTRALLGSRYRSNALAQEKTGEFWVSQQMVGGMVRGDFEHCEVGIFLGKNPWQSHSVPRARVTVREIGKDPDRCLIVIDPKRTETADLADIHLPVRPGTDAWLLLALLGTLVEEGLTDAQFLAEKTDGWEEVRPQLQSVSVTQASEACGIDEDLLRKTARRIARASSVAIFEDLGVQMNRHSTLVSYLQRLIWMSTGNFGRLGTQYIPTSIVPLAAASSSSAPTTPVTGSRVISGLVPCNVITEEILTDHDNRFRAMLVESANPVHSLADSPRMREALEALDLVVVIDVAMTETARLADYVLPATTQYEKAEAVFFNFEFPENCFFLRRPLLPPPQTDKAGPLPEAEIHARLVEAMGAMPQETLERLRAALKDGGRARFAMTFFQAVQNNPDLKNLAPVILYRTLGETLPEGAKEGAVLWGAAHICAQRNPASLHRAGLVGEGPELGEALFDRIINSTRGLVFSIDPPEVCWDRVSTPGGRLQLAVPEMLESLAALLTSEPVAITSTQFPFVLSAGERRSFTANTIQRDPEWRKKDVFGALAISPADAQELNLATGGLVRLTARRGEAVVPVEISDRMQPGISRCPTDSVSITQAMEVSAWAVASRRMS